MLLCINIGNTNIALGVYAGGRWLSHWRLSTVGTRTSDEYEMLIRPFLQRDGIPLEKIDAMAIASVVPELVDTFFRLSRSLLSRDPFFIHSGVETGLDIRIDNKGELGADLVANAVAGYRMANGGTAKPPSQAAPADRRTGRLSSTSAPP
jgi:type III pantothenate kinase